MSEDTKYEPMPDKFKVLAVYNSERDRGIVHTDEWRQRMAELYVEFAEWSKKERRSR